MKHIQLFNEFLNESQNFIGESSIGDIHIMAQEADSFTAFRKEFMDEYGKPKSVKELKSLEAWLQTIWNENQTNEGLTNESMKAKDYFKDPRDLAHAEGLVRNLKLSDEEIRTKIKSVMKDPSKFNDLMDAMTDELNLKWK
jgi:hypothetical protein